jgi:TonB-dependent receptor
MKKFLLFAFLLPVISAFSQSGTITGRVTEKPAGAPEGPVIGAIVYIDSTKNGKVGTQTDFDGKYSFKVPAGEYAVTCRFFGYSPITIKGVKVEAGKSTSLDFVFDASKNLDSGKVFVFTDYRPTSGQVAVLDTLHNGNNAAVGKGQAEIQKSNATDAGQVARTLPGVTLVDNRFVIVRGLSERYNAVLLNNVLAPSVEADVKAFSFDLVPSTMIDNFIIYQSPSPDLPGEFAGGAIRINTTDIPDRSGLQIGLTGGYRAGTTFSPFSLNKGTSSDFLAMGYQSRALPADFPSHMNNLIGNPAAIQAAGRSLPNSWGYTTWNAPLDTRANVTWNYRFSKPGTKDKTGFQFGNITGISYSNTYTAYESYRLDYNMYNVSTGTSDTVFSYDDQIYKNSVRVAFVQNDAFRFGKNGSQRITFKNLFNQMGDNESIFRGGRNIEEANFRQEYSYHYTQRSIYTGQLGGQHSFNNKRTQFDWTAAYSLSRREDPDWRRARYTKDFAALPDEQYSLYIASAPQPFFLGRIFASMHENTKAAAANFTQVITIGKDSVAKNDGFTFTLKAGIYADEKEREYTVRNIGYKAASIQTYSNYDLIHTPIDQVFDTANVNSTNGVALGESTRAADQYKASNSLQAGYLMAVLPFGNFKGTTDGKEHERIRLSGGVRVEHNVQRLHSNTTQGDTVNVNNDLLHLLPSLNAAYNFSDRMLVRASYGKTINRPEFREIAPLYFYDFLFNAIYVGNDSLKTPTVDNYDLRWEYYPRPGENITVGVFYKHFINPIEVYFIPGVGSGGTRSFTWGNAPQANNYGAEFEIRKKFDSLDIPVIRNIGVVANASWIYSLIDLDKDSIGTKSNQRPMMGQSPWIVNAGIYYQNDSIGLQVNVNYNVIGPRVVIVGIPGVPAVYEMPRHQVDLAIIKTFGKEKNFAVRLNITDLLNQETLLLQDANDDGKLNRANDQRMQYFKRGTYFTLGASVRL